MFPATGLLKTPGMSADIDCGRNRAVEQAETFFIEFVESPVPFGGGRIRATGAEIERCSEIAWSPVPFGDGRIRAAARLSITMSGS